MANWDSGRGGGAGLLGACVHVMADLKHAIERGNLAIKQQQQQQQQPVVSVCSSE